MCVSRPNRIDRFPFEMSVLTNGTMLSGPVIRALHVLPVSYTTSNGPADVMALKSFNVTFFVIMLSLGFMASADVSHAFMAIIIKLIANVRRCLFMFVIFKLFLGINDIGLDYAR